MSSYSITTPETTLGLRPTMVRNGETAKGSATYSVTNKTGTTLHTRLHIAPGESANPSWFTVRDGDERDIGPGATESFSVDVAVPGGAGSQTFSAVAVNLADPDNDFEEGSVVAFESPALKADSGGKFPWWIVAVAGGLILLVGGAVAVFLVIGQGGAAADLTVDSVSVAPQEVTFGRDMTIEATARVGNRAEDGDAAPAGYDVDFLLSRDDSAPITAATVSETFEEDSLLANGRVSNTPPLAPGESADIGPARLSLAGLETGDYFICAVADTAGVIDEDVRENNVACGALSVVEAPVSTSTTCADSIQGRIAWNYNGATRWSPANVQRLCAGAEDSPEPGRCFQRVMHGGVNWGAGTQWEWANAVDLCEGTRDAARTVACFERQMRATRDWRTAIARCN